jgi:hypothetical protein
MNVLFLGSAYRYALLLPLRLSIVALLLLIVIPLDGQEPSSAAAGGTGYVSGKVYLDRDMDGEEDKDDPRFARYPILILSLMRSAWV